MKFSSFHVLPLMAGMLLSLTACNGGEEATTDTSANTDSVATDDAGTATAMPASTIVTTPQGMVMIKVKVKDYGAWKKVYDQRDSLRKANGVHSYVISRGANDSNTLFTVFKVDDIAKAKAYITSPATVAAMRGAGAIGMPLIRYVNTTFQDTAMLGSTVLRSITSFNIKDWAAWEKNFKDGEQERLDNGLMVRAYGHEADDTKKVVVVTAVNDTAKAYAYWKSDMLKKRRAAGGVTSEPDRFVFRIVQRY